MSDEALGGRQYLRSAACATRSKGPRGLAAGYGPHRTIHLTCIDAFLLTGSGTDPLPPRRRGGEESGPPLCLFYIHTLAFQYGTRLTDTVRKYLVCLGVLSCPKNAS